MSTYAHSLDDAVLAHGGLLPAGAVGIDAGMTMTKVVHAAPEGVRLSAMEKGALGNSGRAATGVPPAGARVVGITGARAALIDRGPAAIASQEIDAAARGCAALLRAEARLDDGVFLMALLGTGTAFASVRDGNANHMGGTPLGGGSFSGIASRLVPSRSYDDWIAGAVRGDRRKVDAMISEIYPDGIGRIGPDLTAAHLSKRGAGDDDDFLAGLLNLHGENIAQIAAGRAAMASLRRIVLCGGFVHNNHALVDSISHMAGLFGLTVETAPAPGYAGALGAALIASDEASPNPGTVRPA